MAFFVEWHGRKRLPALLRCREYDGDVYFNAGCIVCGNPKREGRYGRRGRKMCWDWVSCDVERAGKMKAARLDALRGNPHRDGMAYIDD